MPDFLHYFAYGSNMQPAQMRRRCPGSVAVGPAIAHGYALVFPVHSTGDWQGGVASLDPAPGHAVQGVLYQITPDDHAALDHYEAVDQGMYRREQITLTHPPTPACPDGRTGTALTYLANHGYNAPAPPSRRYLDALITGAKHHRLDEKYIAQLQAIATPDG